MGYNLIKFFLLLGLAIGFESKLMKVFSSDTEEIRPPAKKPRITKSISSESNTDFAQDDEVKLQQGKGSKQTGGGPGGFFWKILYKEKSAGKVFINRIEEEPLGEHASIQIFLNKSSQGKHIGRIAYQKACALSDYEQVYAHMSKQNLASYRAALAAGFKELNIKGVPQRLMKWTRK